MELIFNGDVSLKDIPNDVDGLFTYDNTHLLDWNMFSRFRNLNNLQIHYAIIRCENDVPEILIRNLKVLTLSTTPSSDFDIIYSLANLESLFLVRDNLVHVDFLSPLRSLKTLNISHNNIKDLKVLESLKNLEILDCSYNRMSSIDPIAKLNKLKYLSCEENGISSLEPLRNLTKLEYLDVSNNLIKSVEPLISLENLQILYTSVRFFSSTAKGLPENLTRIGVGYYIYNENETPKIKEKSGTSKFRILKEICLRKESGSYIGGWLKIENIASLYKWF